MYTYMYMRRMFWTLRLNEGRRIKEKLNSIPERAFLFLPPPRDKLCQSKKG